MDVYSLTLIARDSAFQERVKYHMAEKALAVHAGAPTAADLRLIQKVLDGAEPVAQWALAAVTNATIAAGTHTLDGSSISDSDLQYQIHSQWAAFLV